MNSAPRARETEPRTISQNRVHMCAMEYTSGDRASGRSRCLLEFRASIDRVDVELIV